MFGEAGAPCQSDADCPDGFACRTVRIGEIAQQTCVLQASPSDAGAPAIDAVADAGAPVVGPRDAGNLEAAPPDAGPGVCGNWLSVTIVSVSPKPRTLSPGTKGSCYLDTSVDATVREWLSYPCKGGAASVTFGTETFAGTETGGAVTLTNAHSYSEIALGVHCEFNTTETISGSLASGTLQYSYSEVLASGQSSLCPLLFVPCSASGTVAVQ
jgi:hypothetical protein